MPPRRRRGGDVCLRRGARRGDDFRRGARRGGDRSAGAVPPASSRQSWPHQLDGLAWLAAMPMASAICRRDGPRQDDQTSRSAHCKFGLGLDGPSLIVCPLSVLAWLGAAASARLRVVDLGRRGRREQLGAQGRAARPRRDHVRDGKAPAMASCLAGATWWRCVVLGGSRDQGESSEIARAVRRMKCVSALLLTVRRSRTTCTSSEPGSFLHPLWFPRAERFDAAFVRRRGPALAARCGRVRLMLRPLMLRRLKADVERRLPPRSDPRALPAERVPAFLVQETAAARLGRRARRT